MNSPINLFVLSRLKRLFMDLYTTDFSDLCYKPFLGHSAIHKILQLSTVRHDKRLTLEKILAEYHFKIAHGFVWPKVHS